MNFEIKPMKIEVEINNPDIMMETWVESRDQFLVIDRANNRVYNKKTNEQWNIDEYKSKVFDMDLGMAYFQFAKFKMTTSIVLRELFYTFLEKARWARTARYATVSSMTCSEEMYEPGVTEKAFDKFIEMTNLYNEGKFTQFDKVRETMPISYQVSWEIGLPVKQFIKYVSLVYVHFHDVLPQLWEGLWMACMEVKELRPWMNRILKYSKSDEITKYLLKNNECFSDRAISEDFKDYGKIGMVLYSQLIRHEDTHCLGYIDFIKNLPKDKLHNCALTFPVRVKQTKARENEMLRIRCSWFAVHDDWNNPNTWGSVLSKYIPDGAQIENYKHLFKFFDEDGEFHPELIHRYDTDDSLRLHKGYNAYFPDALALEYKDLIRQRAERYGWTPLLRLYEQLFDKGYIKDNPENPMRKKWVELNSK